MSCSCRPIVSQPVLPALTLRVNEEEVIFNFYRSMKFPYEEATCHQIDTIGDCVKKSQLSSNLVDPLEKCLTPPEIDNSKLTDEEVMHYLYALEALQRETTLLYFREELVGQFTPDVIVYPTTTTQTRRKKRR